MSTWARWLAGRRPEPPEGLAGRLKAAASEEEPSRTASLVDAARAELDGARGAPGRVRESALRLLTSDALFSYACESALDHPDPLPALEAMVRSAGTVGP